MIIIIIIIIINKNNTNNNNKYQHYVSLEVGKLPSLPVLESFLKSSSLKQGSPPNCYSSLLGFRVWGFRV